MKFQEVIDRALVDKAFAERLKAQAEAVSRRGVRSKAWETAMKNFAETPEELAQLKDLRLATGEALNTTTTTTITTTTTTLVCTTTTTTSLTTTTTDLPLAIESSDD